MMEIQNATLASLSVDGRGSYGIGASAVERSEDLYTYLRITDIRDDGTLNMADLKSVDDEKASQYLLKPNDIVFARTGASTGRNYFYDGTDGEFVYAGFLIKFSIDPQKVNPKYVKYYCMSDAYKGWIHSFNTGSTRGNINAQTLGGMPIPLPPRQQQDGIVELLSSLDNKIRKNTEVNENLQEQAFVLFDRLFTGSQGDLCPLNQIAELNPKRQIAKGAIARCIDMARLSTSGAFPSGWEMKPFTGGLKFTNGDTIMARITPCLENGKTAFIDFLDESEVAFGSTEYIVVSSRGEYPAEYFYCLARYPAFVDYAVKNMNGSSGRQRVSADILGKFLVPMLKKEEITSFVDVVPSMFQVMRNNSLENVRLTALRDSLLPQLMSGELDVSDLDL